MSHVFFLCRHTEFAPRFPLASRNKNQIALTYHGLTPAETGRCKAFCLLCYQKKLFFHFIRRTSGTSSKEVFQKYGGTAHPAKELSQRNVVQPFQCSFINSVGDASGVIDRGHCPVHRHTFCNGKTRTVQNLGSGPHSHRPTYHTDVFVPLRQ